MTLVPKFTAGATYLVEILNRDGTVAAAFPPKKNLMFIDDSVVIFAVGYGLAGDGSTPNSQALDGTFSMAGNVLTRESGAVNFTTDVKVGEFFKFPSGGQAKVVTITNSTHLVMDRELTIAAGPAVLYHTARKALDNLTNKTTYRPGGDTHYTHEDGTTLYRTRMIFDEETSPVSYQEFGFNLTDPAYFPDDPTYRRAQSRAVFDAPISINAGQQLALTITVEAHQTDFITDTAMDFQVDGWPYVYHVTAFAATGAHWDITVDDATHYEVGRPVLLALRTPEHAVTHVAPGGSTFTVTAAGHGLSSGQTAVIRGTSNDDYNGAFPVASVSGDDVTLTATISGTSTGGTIRLAEPDPWYPGTGTIDSFPAPNVIRILSSFVASVAVGGGEITNSTAATARMTGHAPFGTGAPTGEVAPGLCDPVAVGYTYMYLANETYAIPGPYVYGVDQPEPFYGLPGYPEVPDVDRNKWNVYTDFDSDEGMGFTHSWTIDYKGERAVKQIVFTCLSSQMWINFDEVQRKAYGKRLRIRWGRSQWEPDLS